MTLSRWTPEDRKTEKLAEHVEAFELSANGEKMLLALAHGGPEGEAAPGGGGQPNWVIVPATAPVKPGEGALNFGELKLKVAPHEEWAQMYHEVWRIERAYFYNPDYDGVKMAEDEKRFEPWVESIASRADLNYIFQEMLSPFSVGHLRGNGGAIPEAKHVAGGLLGADYEIENNRYCFSKIYTGGPFNPGGSCPAGAARAERERGRLHPGHQRPRPDRRHQHPGAAGGHRRASDQPAHRLSGRHERARHRRDADCQRGRAAQRGLDRRQPEEGGRALRREAGLRVSAGHRRRRIHQLQPLLLCADAEGGRDHRRALQRRRSGGRLLHRGAEAADRSRTGCRVTGPSSTRPTPPSTGPR